MDGGVEYGLLEERHEAIGGGILDAEESGAGSAKEAGGADVGDSEAGGELAVGDVEEGETGQGGGGRCFDREEFLDGRLGSVDVQAEVGGVEAGDGFYHRVQVARRGVIFVSAAGEEE